MNKKVKKTSKKTGEKKDPWRPTKYKKEWDKKAEKFLSKGYSKEALAGQLGISIETFFQWINKDGDYFKESFSESVARGNAKGRLFWEKLGINGTRGKIKNFGGTTWAFNMKNRYKWKDRQDITTDDVRLPGPVIFKPSTKK